jgi:hypothetical protein
MRDPSSTTITSQSVNVWLTTLASASSRNPRRSYVGMITLTRGMPAYSWSHAPSAVSTSHECG